MCFYCDSEEVLMDEKENPADVDVKTTSSSSVVDICPCARGLQKAIPLIDYLCEHFKCSIKELLVVFQNLEQRRALVNHLRNDFILRTTHLRPFMRNFTVHCCDLTSQNAHTLPAYRGYLDITVSYCIFTCTLYKKN